MNNQTYPFRQIFHRSLFILVIIFVLVSCQLLPTQKTETPPDAAIMETAQTQEFTPPALPGTFQTELLNPLDTPHTYTDDTCRYLRNKWNPLNAEPGTVVMVIMIDEIKRVGEEGNGISVVEFIKVMEQLKAQGFEAITTKQFQAFMERNIKIPARSLLIIQDGNYDAEYFERNFGEYWMEWGWPIVNGWVSDPELSEGFVRENITLEHKGFVDHQAQGVFTDTKLSDDSAKNVIARELQGSVDGFATHYGKNPIIIIWPNGGFGIRPVEAARQLRFKLGFTSNTRGPLMYNWVPLAGEVDPLRPDYIPEGRINDPLMTLPRYTPQQALLAIDAVRAIGKEAAAYAQANKEIEHHYYEIVCAETYGPMPTP